MKNKSIQLILISIAGCLLLFNFGLLYLHQQSKIKLVRAAQSIVKLEHLKNVEYMFMDSKKIAISKFSFEQHSIGNVYIYLGSDNDVLTPIRAITNQPKLVLGLNQNMCRPCIEGVFSVVKKFFPDFETNPNILCIADVEQRFKDNYFGKKVVSFNQKDDFPLYELDAPYLFILDKDLCIKLLFITDRTSPELTEEYLKIIKERFPVL